MVLIVHHQAEKVIGIRYKNEELRAKESDLCGVFWEIANKFPNEIIVWCEKDFKTELDTKSLMEIFHHDLIMATYAMKTSFLSDSIGYIDQMPFVNVNRGVQYATWRMSTDVGGIKGKVLMKFQNLLESVKDFNVLLNSIAKLGQQNGLFCYSTPLLIKDGFKSHRSSRKVSQLEKLKYTASTRDLFLFVFSHYHGIRLFLLFWCYMKYENSFPIWTMVVALFTKKYFRKNIDLSEFAVKSIKQVTTGVTVDVIIPTLGRRDYLLDFLEDLRGQTHLPQKVIIVEQNPDPSSQTELPELKTESWPFKIVHHFTHQTGACNARNIALEEVDADWVFFADDDNKMKEDVLKNALQEINRLGVYLLTLKYIQEGETSVFGKIKQWGTFGAGNSLVSGKFASLIRFDVAFEHGYAEDKDYGMQLRNVGCDIIYHPNLEILHLKAPRGGFREFQEAPWNRYHPKPSPTLMLYAKKYYSLEQIKGFKTELFLRYFFKQEIKNPFKYLKIMRKRWRKSEEWAEKIKALRIKRDKIVIQDEV